LAGSSPVSSIRGCLPAGSSSAAVHLFLMSFTGELEHPEMTGVNYAHGIAQALWHTKL
jgi:hypothetical protein